MYPFLKRVHHKTFIKLHKQLYPPKVLEKIKHQDPNSIISFKSQRNHYFLELKVDTKKDYLDFLNYLIYLERNS